MIVLDEENKIFTLHTRNTTYQMKAGQYNVLLHTYYGRGTQQLGGAGKPLAWGVQPAAALKRRLK